VLKRQKSEVQRLPADKAFTLFELAVVIFILSLVMALAIPSLYKIGEGRIKSEAGRLASMLRYSNDNAVSRKETYPLKFNLDKKSVTWTAPEGEKTERLDSLFRVSTTSTGNVSTGELNLLFTPLGIQENLIVTLREGDKEILVTFNPLNGRAKIIQNEI
jgi:prepilin-type N-terminal cleavage/methylation domain-containing protein